MISTIPPPRPVSVNSLARTSIPGATTTGQKTNRITSAEVSCHDNSLSSVSTVTQNLSSISPASPVSASTNLQPPRRATSPFANLPIEIHEVILDHLFGERVSAFITTTTGKSSSQSWNKALRHPRRKALSNLALISRVWTPLVQSRIYRHIKVKGTTEGLAECAEWFSEHPHLTNHVRHIEVWIPVWGSRASRPPPRQPRGRRLDATDTRNVDAIMATLWAHSDPSHGNDIHYHCATHNATLDEIFQLIQIFFSAARVLTLEGGHCKNPPMVQHFRNHSNTLVGRQRLSVLPNIQTLVMRGSWNLMRDSGHWYNLARALPALREWHCGYAQPQPEVYFTMSQILVRPPRSVRHVNLSLEGFYNNKDTLKGLFGTRTMLPPICQLLGELAPRLESLAFTGKICATFFQALQYQIANSPTRMRLKSLDLVVKTCCAGKGLQSGQLPFTLSSELSGITNMGFIYAFEKMVIGAVQCLSGLPALDYLRIRFIDLDSPCPLLNPYFQLIGDQCAGLWSYPILDALRINRPEAHFVELADGIYPQYGPNQQIVGAVYPRARPRSIQACMYKIIADASKS
ncbi:hypothetical protein NUU61_005790 [Penicillium alfredii]|uniref:Uncharacterized protein n=1 Tax=Penicillium alfredii TaxID=1506179 RepID=A0A9W9K7X0_9EURO|nr:uncharacterized protein NUU61_005790 [Penicillium alfredii]KAJ5096434.1 hypothetical protein NUU61_005790 [Penicillium alfredii]